MAAQAQSAQNFASTPQTFRILVENRHVGGLIGKSGVHMKTLQTDTGMQCSIRKAASESAQERVMLIRGTGAELEKGILGLAQLYQNANPPRAQGVAAAPSEEVTIRLIVHSSQIGAIIGKGGVTVNDMRQGTGATINVAGEPLPLSSDQLVTITGTPNVVALGVLRVVKQMFENPVRAGAQSVEYVPGASVDVPVGAGAQVSAASLPIALQQALAQWLSTQQGGTDRRVAPGASGLLPRRGGPRQTRGAPVVDAASITHTFVVPTSACGTVIGRGGENVKAIRADTGCTIVIRNAEKTNPEQRLVTVVGNQQMVLTATARIQQLVQEAQAQQAAEAE